MASAPGSAPSGPGTQPPAAPAEVDPLSKFKMLIPRVKESLANLMKVAAQVFDSNAQVDNCLKHSEGAALQRFDRSLEEFYAICDQLELNLRIALECASQNSDTQKHTPIPVQGLAPKPLPPADGQPPPPPPDQQSYLQYLSTVRTQVNCAKEVHDALLECARKVGERSNPLQQQQQQQQQQLQAQQQQQQQQLPQPQLQATT